MSRPPDMSAEYLLDDDEEKGTESNRRRHPKWSSNSPMTLSLPVILQLIGMTAICGLLVAILVRLSKNGGNCQCAAQEDTHTTQFGRSLQYMSLDHLYDGNWEPYLSPYLGQIRINLDEPEEPPAWGSISMFHQLHCLAGFRHALQRAHDGEDIGLDHRNDTHWPHCLHYMRQAILCSADDTIELPHFLDTKLLDDGTTATYRHGPIDGSNDVRTCRNSEKLERLLSEHGRLIEVKKYEWMVQNRTNGS